MTAEKTCPDCRCTLRTEEGPDGPANRSQWQTTVYCDDCLRERLQAGERVPGGSYVDERTGRERHVFWVVCQQCGGSGQYVVSAWTDTTDCYRCGGFGWLGPEKEEVQRMQRWSSTFQQNRDPRRRGGEV